MITNSSCIIAAMACALLVLIALRIGAAVAITTARLARVEAAFWSGLPLEGLRPAAAEIGPAEVLAAGLAEFDHAVASAHRGAGRRIRVRADLAARRQADAATAGAWMLDAIACAAPLAGLAAALAVAAPAPAVAGFALSAGAVVAQKALEPSSFEMNRM